MQKKIDRRRRKWSRARKARHAEIMRAVKNGRPKPTSAFHAGQEVYLVENGQVIKCVVEMHPVLVRISD
jgi:hypothetical protein